MSTTNTVTDTDSDTKTLIFVYGTLKRGFPNHHLLEIFLATNDAVYLGLHKTQHPYPLVHGPLGVPFLINLPGSGLQVRGEVYSVSSRALARLDELEGIGRGHYERLPVTVTKDGDGEVRNVEGYFGDKSFALELWEKSGKEGVEEYLSSDAEKYVGIEARDVRFSLGDYVRMYLQQ